MRFPNRRGTIVSAIIAAICVASNPLTAAAAPDPSDPTTVTRDLYDFTPFSPEDARNGTYFYQSVPPGCETDDKVRFDANDPLCTNTISEEERTARLLLRDMLESPAYQCADGRNDGIGWRDLYKLSPCPTGALRLRLSWGKLRQVHTTDSVRIYNNSAVPSDGEFYSKLHGWDFYLSKPQATKQDGKTAYYYTVFYEASYGIKPYKTFIRKNGGDWDTVGNLDNRQLESKASYDILITWNEAGHTTPAWLPISNDMLKNLL